MPMPLRLLWRIDYEFILCSVGFPDEQLFRRQLGQAKQSIAT